MENITYSDFISRYHDAAVNNNVFTSCMIDVTYRCTNRCVHCYCLEDASSANKEMSADKIKDILVQLKEAGCLWISFSGGEPFLRSDFLDIYVFAKKLGFIISILTNATLISPEIAQTLGNYKPIQVNVSMYGSDKRNYEEITQVNGSYERFISGVELLKKHNINTQIQTILMTINQEDLDNIQRFSDLNGFGYCKFDPFLFNDVHNTKKSYDYRVLPDKVVLCEIKDKTRYSYWQRFSCKVNVEKLKTVEKPYDCCSTCGVSKVHIDPYGNLMGCNLLRNPCFNLNEFTFVEAKKLLVEKLKDLFHQEYPNTLECRTCKIRHLCNCCPGVSYIENRNLNQKSEYACEIAHARKKYFNLNKN